MDMIAITFMFVLHGIILITGLFMLKYPPKRKNVIFGFRTKRSFLSQDTWMYAQRKSGLYIAMIGAMGLVMIGLAFMLQDEILSVISHDYIVTAITVLPLILVFVSVLIIQLELKKNFDETGKRKNDQNGNL